MVLKSFCFKTNLFKNLTWGSFKKKLLLLNLLVYLECASDKPGRLNCVFGRSWQLESVSSRPSIPGGAGLFGLEWIFMRSLTSDGHQTFSAQVHMKMAHRFASRSESCLFPNRSHRYSKLPLLSDRLHWSLRRTTRCDDQSPQGFFWAFWCSFWWFFSQVWTDWSSFWYCSLRVWPGCLYRRWSLCSAGCRRAVSCMIYKTCRFCSFCADASFMELKFNAKFYEICI